MNSIDRNRSLSHSDSIEFINNKEHIIENKKKYTGFRYGAQLGETCRIRSTIGAYDSNKNETYEQYLLNDFINDYISIHKIYKNYNKYKLFYTWDDFLNIINYFLE